MKIIKKLERTDFRKRAYNLEYKDGAGQVRIKLVIE